MTLEELLKETIAQGASDLHITVGNPPVIRKNGRLVRLECERLHPQDTEAYVKEMLKPEQLKVFEERGEIDLSFSLQGMARFRVNIFKQRGTYCIVARTVNMIIPSMEELGLPEVVRDFARKSKGLVLVTGPTGSGKSTTLAAMVDQINRERDCHILTLEDPIEYLHKHNKSIVNQREIGNDSQSYANALRSALREDPDVILVGEVRDIETIAIAITAAETGHLVLSTLHTLGAANTIDRVIDVFSAHQQQQIRVQLSTVLQGVISQQLLTRRDKPGRVAAIEIMTVTNAVSNLIREKKTFQIQSVIQTGAKFGMQMMDGSLADLYKKGYISYEDAMTYAMDQDNMMRLIEVFRRT